MLKVRVVRDIALKEREKREKKALKKLEKQIDDEILHAMNRGEFYIEHYKEGTFTSGERKVMDSYSEVGGFEVERVNCFVGEKIHNKMG